MHVILPKQLQQLLAGLAVCGCALNGHFLSALAGDSRARMGLLRKRSSGQSAETYK